MKHPDDEDGTKDWRGTPIVPGAPVIYAASVGRSTTLVEGEVVGFTKSGRVNVRVIRRSYGHAWVDSKDVVHVGHDRLLVINPDTLPPTTLPTQREGVAIQQARYAERERIRDSHTGMNYVEDRINLSYRYRWTPCTVCGTTEPYSKECEAP